MWRSTLNISTWKTRKEKKDTLHRKRDIEIHEIKQKFCATYHAKERTKERELGIINIEDVFDAIFTCNIYSDKKYPWTFHVIGKYADYILSKKLDIITIFPHNKDMYVGNRYENVSKLTIARILWIKIKPNMKSIRFRKNYNSIE